jgi:hypothetical protein
MAEIPPLSPNDRQYTNCPYCTIQIPAEATVCPHCRKVIPSSGKKARAPAAPGKRESGFLERLRTMNGGEVLSDLWILHGKWIKVGGPVLAAILLLFLVYGVWVGYKVRIVPNSALPVTVEQEKKDRAVLLKVFVTNEGEDVPDLSLKSIGVVMEFVYRDGRREKKTVFPKAEFRGEGALLHGETGSIEIEAPTKELKEVILRSEVVDLGTGRMLVPPGGRRRVVPDQR